MVVSGRSGESPIFSQLLADSFFSCLVLISGDSFGAIRVNSAIDQGFRQQHARAKSIGTSCEDSCRSISVQRSSDENER